MKGFEMTNVRTASQYSFCSAAPPAAKPTPPPRRPPRIRTYACRTPRTKAVPTAATIVVSINETGASASPPSDDSSGGDDGPGDPPAPRVKAFPSFVSLPKQHIPEPE